MKKNHDKFFQWLSAIAIGLVGSALWEIIFSPLTQKIINLIVMVPAKISSSFSSYYVESITSADSQYLSIGIRKFIWVVLIFLTIFDFNILQIKKKSTWLWNYMRILIFIFFTLDTMYDSQVYSEAHSFLRNIEIVAPYISDEEYKAIKSNFYQMENIDDYNSLQNELDSIARKNNLKLK